MVFHTHQEVLAHQHSARLSSRHHVSHLVFSDVRSTVKKRKSSSLPSSHSRRYAPGGEVALPMVVNACVHVVMYLYYALAAMHIQRKQLARVKLFVTIIQVQDSFDRADKDFPSLSTIDKPIRCRSHWMFPSLLRDVNSRWSIVLRLSCYIRVDISHALNIVALPFSQLLHSRIHLETKCWPSES